MIGAFQPVTDRNLPARQIDERAGNEERRDSARPLLMQRHRRFGDALKAADAGADHDASGYLVFVGLGRPAGVGERLGRRRYGVNDELIAAALILRLHPLVGTVGVRRVAARDLRGDLARQIRDFEGFNPRRRRLAGDQPFPRGLDAAGQRRDHAETRHHDPLHPIPSKLVSPAGPVLAPTARAGRRRPLARSLVADVTWPPRRPSPGT